MAPKVSQQKVIDSYEAGCTKDETRQMLKGEGYALPRISQLLKLWPPAGAGPPSCARGPDPPRAQPLPEVADVAVASASSSQWRQDPHAAAGSAHSKAESLHEEELPRAGSEVS